MGTRLGSHAVEQEGTTVTDQVGIRSAFKLHQSVISDLCSILSCTLWHTHLQEAVVMPYLTALADFREKIRKVALEAKGKLAVYCASDMFVKSAINS